MHESDPADSRLFHPIPRRSLLRGGALIAGSATAIALRKSALAAGVPEERVDAWLAMLQPATPEAIADYTPVSLTDAELTTLKAALDRIIPSDELGPGAVDAGVFIFIDRTLAGPDAAALPLYQGGLAALAAAGFDTATADEQDDLLESAEADELADVPAGFFATLLEQTRQGMFGDPIYGGNADFAGWDLIGYPGIKLTWSAEEQAIDTIVEPEHVSVAEFGGQAS